MTLYVKWLKGQGSPPERLPIGPKGETSKNKSKIKTQNTYKKKKEKDVRLRKQRQKKKKLQHPCQRP